MTPAQSPRDPLPHPFEGCEVKRLRAWTIPAPGPFRQSLERKLTQGFGQDREEFDDAIRCAGMPIFDRHNQVVAGLSVSFPTLRREASRDGELAKMLRDASRDIGRQLGCAQFPLDPPEAARH